MVSLSFQYIHLNDTPIVSIHQFISDLFQFAFREWQHCVHPFKSRTWCSLYGIKWPLIIGCQCNKHTLTHLRSIVATRKMKLFPSITEPFQLECSILPILPFPGSQHRLVKLESQSAIFFVPCDLDIWQVTLKNNRAPRLCDIKVCASFCNHWWIQTGVTVRKLPIWVKFNVFKEPCDLEIWRMTLENNKTHILCYSKLWASFRSHWWIQTGVTGRKRPILVKFDDFLAVWSWNLTDDLERQKGFYPKQHQTLCIISSSLLSLVITTANFMMIRLWQHSVKVVTCRQTDGRTEGRPQTFIELLGRS